MGLNQNTVTVMDRSTLCHIAIWTFRYSNGARCPCCVNFITPNPGTFVSPWCSLSASVNRRNRTVFNKQKMIPVVRKISTFWMRISGAADRSPINTYTGNQDDEKNLDKKRKIQLRMNCCPAFSLINAWVDAHTNCKHGSMLF